MTTPFDDKLHEECGVFGVFGHSEAPALTALGLHFTSMPPSGLTGGFTRADPRTPLRGTAVSLAVM